MNDKELETILLEFEESEIIYKRLYLKNPILYENPINNWIDFAEDYIASFEENVEIPLKAPSAIEQVFNENDWFPRKELEVSILKNNRYCT